MYEVQPKSVHKSKLTFNSFQICKAQLTSVHVYLRVRKALCNRLMGCKVKLSPAEQLLPLGYDWPCVGGEESIWPWVFGSKEKHMHPKRWLDSPRDTAVPLTTRL